jgi:hypothetical protein
MLKGFPIIRCDSACPHCKIGRCRNNFCISIYLSFPELFFVGFGAVFPESIKGKGKAGYSKQSRYDNRDQSNNVLVHAMLSFAELSLPFVSTEFSLYLLPRQRNLDVYRFPVQ